VTLQAYSLSTRVFYDELPQKCLESNVYVSKFEISLTYEMAYWSGLHPVGPWISSLTSGWYITFFANSKHFSFKIAMRIVKWTGKYPFGSFLFFYYKVIPLLDIRRKYFKTIWRRGQIYALSKLCWITHLWKNNQTHFQLLTKFHPLIDCRLLNLLNPSWKFINSKAISLPFSSRNKSQYQLWIEAQFLSFIK